MRLKVVSYLLLLALKPSVSAQLPVREAHVKPFEAAKLWKPNGHMAAVTASVLSDCPLGENNSVPITSASIFVLLGWSCALTVFEGVYMGFISCKISLVLMPLKSGDSFDREVL